MDSLNTYISPAIFFLPPNRSLSTLTYFDRKSKLARKSKHPSYYYITSSNDIQSISWSKASTPTYLNASSVFPSTRCYWLLDPLTPYFMNSMGPYPHQSYKTFLSSIYPSSFDLQGSCQDLILHVLKTSLSPIQYVLILSSPIFCSSVTLPITVSNHLSMAYILL